MGDVLSRRKYTKAQCFTVFLFISCLVLLWGLAFIFFSLRASNKILADLKLVRPGDDISEVEKKFGKPMYVFDADKGGGASITDSGFCKDKKLYWFYRGIPPARAIEVYTNKDGIVVYVTWRSL